MTQETKLHSLSVGSNIFYYADHHDSGGILETAVLDVYDTHEIAEGWTVVDIGAGVGDFAVLASHRVGPTGKVIAIEPAPLDFQCLRRNLEVNQCHNVTPIQTAISSRETELLINFKGRATSVRSRRLRDVISEVDVHPEEIRFVKVDVEGAERVVIPDNLEILRHCERVAIELHDAAGELLDPVMHRIGFEFRRLSRKKYLRKALVFCLRHPLQGLRVFRAVRRSDAYHGIRKFLHGMEITQSANLVVGEYVPSQSSGNRDLPSEKP